VVDLLAICKATSFGLDTNTPPAFNRMHGKITSGPEESLLLGGCHAKVFPFCLGGIGGMCGGVALLTPPPAHPYRSNLIGCPSFPYCHQITLQSETTLGIRISSSNHRHRCVRSKLGKLYKLHVRLLQWHNGRLRVRSFQTDGTYRRSTPITWSLPEMNNHSNNARYSPSMETGSTILMRRNLQEHMQRQQQSGDKSASLTTST